MPRRLLVLKNPDDEDKRLVAIVNESVGVVIVLGDHVGTQVIYGEDKPKQQQNGVKTAFRSEVEPPEELELTREREGHSKYKDTAQFYRELPEKERNRMADQIREKHLY